MARRDLTMNVIDDHDGTQTMETDLLLPRTSASEIGIDYGAQMNSSLRKAHRCIGRFFYEIGIDFETVNYPSFKNMINTILGEGQRDYDIPSCQDLKGWILEEVMQEMQQYVEQIRKSWARTGCSILFDEWTDKKGGSLVNFIVDCPQGPVYLRSYNISGLGGDDEALLLLFDEVIEEVGAGNVVQVIASCATGGSWTEAFRKQFEGRDKNVFWTVSASHCIGLILDSINGMMVPFRVREILDKAKTMTKFIYGHATVLKLLRYYTHGNSLIKPSKIRSATPFLTLENMVLEKKNLKRMFASSEWNNSVWTSKLEGKRVADLVGDACFWDGAMMALKAAMPLVNALSLINKADKPTVGYIYETMDQAKETIRDDEFENESKYKPIWDAIDEIWDTHLHGDLHVVGYYLNPSFFYADEFCCDPEVIIRQLSCTVRMVEDQRVQQLIAQQAKGAFKKASAAKSRNDIPPAEWWLKYGNHCPELQSFAIKMLSQTCDGASRYGLKKSLAEKLLREAIKRSPVEQQVCKDLAFVHYNLQLQSFEPSKNGDIVSEEIDPMDDWIVNEMMAQDEDEDGESTWMDLDFTEKVTH